MRNIFTHRTSRLIVIGSFLLGTAFVSCKRENIHSGDINNDPNITETDNSFKSTSTHDPIESDIGTKTEGNLDYALFINSQLEFAKTAQKHIKSTKVKDYAIKLVLEYENTLKEMEDLGGEKLENFTKSMNNEQKAELESFHNAEHKNYDRDFLERIIDLQLQAREKLWNTRNETNNTDLQAFYDKMIQEMELRIDHARQLLEK